jgi:hypothetical protein
LVEVEASGRGWRNQRPSTTDTFTHALAVADTEALSAAAAAWSHGEYAVQGLATVARHAAAHGHHMYSFWYF